MKSNAYQGYGDVPNTAMPQTSPMPVAKPPKKMVNKMAKKPVKPAVKLPKLPTLAPAPMSNGFPALP